MNSWEEIREWRRAKRAELRSRRLSVPREEKDRLRAIATRLIRQHVPDIGIACTGFYWPFKGEVDLRHFVRDLVGDGGEVALPVVIERAHPLEFWSWRPHAKMQRGIWNIPIPADRIQVQPTLLLVPLVGVDGAGYRLGYGGGYYDRTLARASPRPMTVGIGYELGRLDSIHPQPHDIPMDAIITENGFSWIRKPEGAAHDQVAPAAGPADSTRLDRTALLDLLGQLLEAERAGARSVGRMCNEAATPAVGTVLRDVARDEARFCAMLTTHIKRLGGTPSLATGAFYDKVMALPDADQRLDLLNRGQGWVVRRLQESLPRIDDAALRADLQDMLDVHARNIATCARLGPLPKLEQPPAHAAQGR
jgi:5-formyltetrahydrofolate cyclo-ligase